MIVHASTRIKWPRQRGGQASGSQTGSGQDRTTQMIGADKHCTSGCCQCPGLSAQRSYIMQHPIRLVILLTLLIDASTQAAAPQADRGAAASRKIYFPPAGIEWDHVTPSAVGWDPAGIADALEFAGSRGSSSVVILYRGRILAEQHWNLASQPQLANGQRNRYHAMRHGRNARGHDIEDVASIQKSVVAILTGIAQHKGLLKISDPVHQHLGTGWSQAKPAAEAQITLRHLLTMSSGLNDRLEFVAPAGKRWRYNTAAYSRVLRCLAAVSDQDANQLTRAWLTQPIGMNDSRWVPRPGRTAATSANPLGFATSAHDLARFGLLVLAQGNWNATAVLPDQEYLKSALTSRSFCKEFVRECEGGDNADHATLSSFAAHVENSHVEKSCCESYFAWA